MTSAGIMMTIPTPLPDVELGATAMSLIHHPIFLRVGWTLVHSVWQIALVAALLWCIRRICWQQSASLRYTAALIAMLAALAMPVATLCWAPLPAESVAAGDMAAHRNAQGMSTSPETDAQAAGRPDQVATISETAAGSPAWSFVWADTVSAWLPWLVMGWLMGVGLLAMRPVVGWLGMRRLRTTGLAPVPDAVRALLHRVAARMRIRQAVDIAISALVEVPAVVGCARPLILLPASALTELSPAALEAIIAHELAHVRRYDFLVNLLQTVIESLLFYHPALWWISGQIHQERENCCDDVAVSVCGNRVEYIRALASLEARRVPAPRTALAAAGGTLIARLRRLVSADLTSQERPRPAITTVAVLALGAIAGGAMLIVGLLLVAEYDPVLSGEDATKVTNNGPMGLSTITTDRSPNTQASENPPLEALKFIATEPPPADWFRPAPFPEIGYPRPDDDYWQFVRLAAHRAVHEEFDADPRQRESLLEIHSELSQQQRTLIDRWSREEQPAATDRKARKRALWHAARDRMEALLTGRQQERIREIIIQRSRHSVFFYPHLAPELELSSEQREWLRELLQEHLDRLKQYDAEHGQSQRRVTLGQESYRRFWNEAHAVLTPVQREAYERLRGQPVRQG